MSIHNAWAFQDAVFGLKQDALLFVCSLLKLLRSFYLICNVPFPCFFIVLNTAFQRGPWSCVKNLVLTLARNLTILNLNRMESISGDLANCLYICWNPTVHSSCSLCICRSDTERCWAYTNLSEFILDSLGICLVVAKIFCLFFCL